MATPSSDLAVRELDLHARDHAAAAALGPAARAFAGKPTSARSSGSGTSLNAGIPRSGTPSRSKAISSWSLRLCTGARMEGRARRRFRRYRGRLRSGFGRNYGPRELGRMADPMATRNSANEQMRMSMLIILDRGRKLELFTGLGESTGAWEPRAKDRVSGRGPGRSERAS